VYLFKKNPSCSEFSLRSDRDLLQPSTFSEHPAQNLTRRVLRYAICKLNSSPELLMICDARCDPFSKLKADIYVLFADRMGGKNDLGKYSFSATACFVVCRVRVGCAYHRLWEPLLLVWDRILP